MLATMAGAMAKPVDPAVLSRIAGNFFPGRAVTFAQYADAVYVATPTGGSGFLLLAGDDCVRPVLAYSRTATFDPQAMPVHVAEWIDGYAREIASVRTANLPQSVRVAAEWNRWMYGYSPKNEADSVGPMLTTAWNQGRFFNTLCPYDQTDSMHCYTGCTATATAQIMNYWEHPAVGWGSYAYYHPMYGVQSAQFDTMHYRWSMMPDTLNYLTDPDSALAVAELMYHVGVAVGMNYGTSGSGAAVNSYGSATRASAENALKYYFKYNPMLFGVFKQEYTDAEWDSIMYSEIVAGRPVLYAGYDSSGGHAFVLDGYSRQADSLGGRLFFRVNWGWGGSYDGYYTLDSLAPGAGGAGGNATYTFNMNNSAVIGIMPATSTTDTTATISVEPDNVSHGTVSGSGTYNIGTDNVYIWAHAAEGYRFERWKSGSLQNPVSFTVFGDMTDTAIFVPLRGDTLGYCYDGLVTSWLDDYGSTTEWGIRIPASMRGVGRGMRAVQMLPYVDGDHTLKIYIGDDIETANMVYTKVIPVGYYEAGVWNEYELDSLVVVPEGSVVWVTMSYVGTGVYPASMSRYCGNSDGSWYHQPEGWVQFDSEDIFFGTWMLRAVFEPRQFTVTVMPNDPNVCTTYGEGTHYGGDQVTIGAVILDPRCTFLRWTDGSPYNPYTFTVFTDTVMVAYCNCTGVGIDPVVDDEMQITVDGRTVTVDCESPVAVYDIQGRLLARSRTFVAPAPGVYMVRAGSATRKVVVVF